jgi:hypothetical protein
MMKVLTMILLQCTFLYFIVLGNESLEMDKRAADSARSADHQFRSARCQLMTALDENRGIDSARRLLRAAIRADFAAEAQLGARMRRYWPYRVLLVWPMLKE